MTVDSSVSVSADGRDFVSTPQRLLETAAALEARPAYFTHTADGWRPVLWRDHAVQVQRAARALLALGVQRGQVVAILGFNRPEWVTLDLAAMMIGAVPAGIYWTSSRDEVAYILRHSRAPVLLAENATQLAKIAGLRSELPQLRQVVLMRGTQAAQALDWDGFLALGRDELQTGIEARLAALGPQELGTLIYTSGTTGPPKAVMLTHANLAATAATSNALSGLGAGDATISYLPLAHIAEQMTTIHAQVLSGYAIYFAPSLEALTDTLKEVHPSFFFGVPRVWEKMQAGIEAKLAAAAGVKALLARWSMRVARRFHAARLDGRRTGAWLDRQYRLAERLVLDKVRAAIGFDRARLLVSGAAPIAPATLAFFTSLGLVVQEVYGLSEVSGPASFNLPGATRLGSVGRPIPGMALRIADDGEVLLRGPGVFAGYLHDAEASAAALLPQGWLATGDLGRVDADGFLFVTGRKKDLLITSGGKNIAPANLEADLMNIALVEHAVVVGEGRHFVAALFTLKPEALRAFAAREGLPADDLRALQQHPRVREALQRDVDAVNVRHARVETVRRFAILEQALTIERGELTPTLKIRRNVVVEHHRAAVDALYTD